MLTIRIVSSPFPQDEGLPWEYGQAEFLNWYNEVFRAGYKRNNPPITCLDAVDDLRRRGYAVEWSDSLYRGNEPFSRAQLLFAVEAILVAARDRVESGLPTSGVTWQDRLGYANAVDADPKTLTAYDRGALECAGMFLGVLYAQLTGDGLGISDALVCADHFDEAVQKWVATACGDEGEAVTARMKGMPRGGWQFQDVYEHDPDCRRHAEAFVNQVFADYLAEVESPFSELGFELADGGVICFPDDDGDIRRIDSHGNSDEVRSIGDPGWDEWRDLFPDDALYFQPEGAGDPNCGTSAATINACDVYRSRQNAETAHPDCEIFTYTVDHFHRVKQPVFLDVDVPWEW